VTSVTFAPGARTRWHLHEGGQLLIVLSGEGWVGTRDMNREVVHSGDLVWTPAGEEHWHGATDTAPLTHLAVTLGETHWMEATPP
jgi:quercetin dioxygenase-like cupin family protein